jgi:hypothetical protein
VLLQIAGFPEQRFGSLHRLCVMVFHEFPLSQDELRAWLLKNATIDDVFAMLTHSSEFKLLIPHASFPVPDIAEHTDKLQGFLE